ncbi:MFS-type transporter SLC18B1-like [Pocillopora damicornis]|uniref:MFS-type transporter SLC18B1-like n=1 Tax=Pocillopora damicornis TaxID=46731 RepID=UPI000F551958|nr:MFS-type transporter SLC18B1-like [Pocillopora damicornis]
MSNARFTLGSEFRAMEVDTVRCAAGHGSQIGEEKKKKDDKESISRLKVLKIPTALMLSLCFVVCGLSFSYPEPILGPHLIENMLCQLDGLIKQNPLTQYLEEYSKMGQNPTNVGLAFLCWAATYTLLAPLVGYIGDKTKCYRTMMIAGFTVLLIGHLLVGPAPFLTFLPAKTIWLLIPAMFLYGISGALGFVPIMPELIKTLREDGMPDDSFTNALVSSIYICMYYLGSVIGPVLAGVLCDHFGFEWSMTVSALSSIIQGI